MNKPEIWVTGSRGFIGSNFINWVKKHKIKFNEFRGDIRNNNDVFKMKYADLIFNFAGPSSISESVSLPEKYIETNIFGTFNLLELARKYPIKKLILISSVEVYGNSLKVDENSPLIPENPYASSKASADILAITYFKLYKIPVVILRLSNQYGPMQGTNKLIPNLITNALKGKPLKIFGDGEKKKFWLYVDDTLEAIWMAANKKNVEGEIFNIVGKDHLSVLEIAEIIRNMINPKIKIKYISKKSFDSSVQKFDNFKTKIKLGWEPKTPINVGLKKTINWYKSIN
ncbi:MAG: GDP-mannose 4,6-dehydratase [Candidatus Aenigmatarchaeota archaeon]